MTDAAPDGAPAGDGSLLGGRAAPWVAGLLAAMAVFLVWGSLRAVPVMHDEWAYWLQADQYAHFRWKSAPPPIPEFFEQLYVLVTPVFAAKYPPGHALTVAGGFVLGLPALVPLLLTACTGALVFALARRAAGAWTGALTWLLWIGTFGNLRFRASYFSETTTSVCWLVAWWALLEWRETRRQRWMLAMAFACGWGAITRPATMFVFAIPLGAVVLRDVVAGKRWHDLALGVAGGLAVLAILPLWSTRTVGNTGKNPLAAYTEQYLPFDVPGFALSSVPPIRALPPEMERVRGFLRAAKQAQVELPSFDTAMSRVMTILRDLFAGWRLPFGAAFVIGLFTLGAPGWFAFGTSVLLMASYLSQAHTADWAIYYLETFPVVAFTAAMGVRAVGERLVARGVVRSGAAPPRPLLLIAAAVAGILLVRDVKVARGVLDRVAAKPRSFQAAVRGLPKRPNLIFVRYAERRSMHISLVANAGVLDGAASWIVHDRGPENARLMAAAPGRTAYLFDEATSEFREMPR